MLKKRLLSLFVANKTTKVMVQCRCPVDKKAITRSSIDGIEHITITSKTLPDDVVMNGGLYPVDEVDKSYMGLERTLAPIEHPTDSQGNFLSAFDPIAIHNFHAGAFNTNVRREGGVIVVDKVINVQEAMKSDRGRRLLDRINEIETNENPRPIHTSVGLFLVKEELRTPAKNKAGQEYTWVARDMVFDHDAILLDSVGAAQPHQGVGMAVNTGGDRMPVEIVNVEGETETETNAEGEMTHSEIREALDKAIHQPPYHGDWVVDVYESDFVFYSDDEYFSAPYVITDGVAQIVGVPTPVDRSTTYTPKTNHQEADAMKDFIVNALKAAGVKTDGLTDEQLLTEYNKLQANSSSGEGDKSDDDQGGAQSADSEVVAALNRLTARLDGFETQLNSRADQEVETLAKTVVDSGKYPGIDMDAAKKLGVNTLKTMVANCKPAFAIPLTVVNSGKSGDDKYEMPA